MTAFHTKRPHIAAVFLFGRFMRALGQIALLWCLVLNVAASDWEHAFAKMPIKERKLRFQKLEVAAVMLKAFTTNESVRGLVFLPGATDYIYFNKSTSLNLARANANLFGAVRTLTNQTPLLATSEGGFLFIRTAEDRLTANVSITSEPSVAQLKSATAPADFFVIDRAWEHFYRQAASAFQPLMLQPEPNNPGTFHFYRCYLRAHDLSSWELLKLLTIATKTHCTIEDTRLIFAEDKKP